MDCYSSKHSDKQKVIWIFIPRGTKDSTSNLWNFLAYRWLQIFSIQEDLNFMLRRMGSHSFNEWIPCSRHSARDTKMKTKSAPSKNSGYQVRQTYNTMAITQYKCYTSDMDKSNYLTLEKVMTNRKGGKMWIHWEMAFGGWTTKRKRQFNSGEDGTCNNTTRKTGVLSARKAPYCEWCTRWIKIVAENSASLWRASQEMLWNVDLVL